MGYCACVFPSNSRRKITDKSFYCGSFRVHCPLINPCSLSINQSLFIAPALFAFPVRTIDNHMVTVALQTDVSAPAVFSRWAVATSSVPGKAMLVFYYFFGYLGLAGTFLVHTPALNLIITMAVTTTSSPSGAVPSTSNKRYVCLNYCCFGSCNFDLVGYSINRTQTLWTVLPPSSSQGGTRNLASFCDLTSQGQRRPEPQLAPSNT